MNLPKLHILPFVVALSFCALAASCSDNEPDGGQGTPLPPGQYPLKFTASVDVMTSRAPGHDAWTDGDEIGIRIGEYPKVGHYRLNSDGTVMSADEALDWQTTAPATVTAWYPYVGLNETYTLPIDNQSAGLDACDFLTAVAENQNYNKTVSMNFKHQMAKVSCKLIKDAELTNEEFGTVKVSIGGYTLASFSNGVLTGSYIDDNENNKWITPIYDTQLSDYEALVVPQNMTGKEFIKIDLTVNSNGNYIDKTLIYSPPEETAQLKAGFHNKYTILVKKDRLEVSFNETSWNDNGVHHPAEPALFRVNMPKNHEQTLIFSDNVIEKNEDYIIVKGNRFSISYEINSDNIIKALFLSEDTHRDVMNREIVDGKYVFNFYLLSEVVTLKYEDYVQPGDYYYADGTWGPPELKGLGVPIGIVFKAGPGGYGSCEDRLENYAGKNLDDIHGYAVALTDAVEGTIIWGDTGLIPDVPTFSKAYNEDFYYSETFVYGYSGYYYTKKIENWGKTGNKNYNAAAAALAYRSNEQIPAPAGSSGWYLPTLQQLSDIGKIPNRTQLFIDVQGRDLITYANKGIYWSCVTPTKEKGYLYSIDHPNENKKASKVDRNTSESGTSSNKTFHYVRAVLTF